MLQQAFIKNYLKNMKYCILLSETISDIYVRRLNLLMFLINMVHCFEWSCVLEFLGFLQQELPNTHYANIFFVLVYLKSVLTLKFSSSKPEQGRNTECCFGQLFQRGTLGCTHPSSNLFYVFIELHNGQLTTL